MTKGDQWERVNEEFSALGRTLRDQFRKVDQGADEDAKQEVKDALQALTEAANRVATSTGNALRDPAIRNDAKRAADSVFDALGGTFSDLADEFRRRRGSPKQPPS